MCIDILHVPALQSSCESGMHVSPVSFGSSPIPVSPSPLLPRPGHLTNLCRLIQTHATPGFLMGFLLLFRPFPSEATDQLYLDSAVLSLKTLLRLPVCPGNLLSMILCIICVLISHQAPIPVCSLSALGGIFTHLEG